MAFPAGGEGGGAVGGGVGAGPGEGGAPAPLWNTTLMMASASASVTLGGEKSDFGFGSGPYSMKGWNTTAMRGRRAAGGPSSQKRCCASKWVSKSSAWKLF